MNISISIKPIKKLKRLFNIFKMPFDNNTCSLENVAGAVKLFPEMTNSAKIHDNDAIIQYMQKLKFC